MQEPELSLTTMFKGAIPDLFKRQLAEVVRNMKDVNTKAEDKRSISIEITFHPFKDRSGFLYTLEPPKMKLSGVNVSEIQGSAFITTQDGEWKVFAHDPRQTQLFAQESTTTPKQ